MVLARRIDKAMSLTCSQPEEICTINALCSPYCQTISHQMPNVHILSDCASIVYGSEVEA
jgi:hypothetical protein